MSGRDRVEQCGGIDPALAVAADQGEVVAGGAEADRGVLDRAGHDVGTAGGGAEDRVGDGLGRAAREDHLAAARAEQRGDLLAGLLDGHPRRLPSWWMRAGSPASPSSHATMASLASGRVGEVDAWSR